MRSTMFLTLAFSLLLKAIQAQQTEDVYKFFNAAWKPVSEKKAIYLLRIRYTKDSCWQYSYYNMSGPLIRVETYQDQQATIRQGLFAWYNREGAVDSSGYFYQGLRDKDWMYFFSAENHSSEYYDKGRLLSDKEFKERQKLLAIIDPSFPDFSRLSPESYFPGGDTAWRQYMNKNLHYPKRAYDRRIEGTVLTEFLVQPTGKLEDIQIRRSIELSLDDEAILLLENSPNWIPAIRYELKVRSWKAQPIGFRLEVSNTR